MIGIQPDQRWTETDRLVSDSQNRPVLCSLHCGSKQRCCDALQSKQSDADATDKVRKNLGYWRIKTCTVMFQNTASSFCDSTQCSLTHFSATVYLCFPSSSCNKQGLFAYTLASWTLWSRCGVLSERWAVTTSSLVSVNISQVMFNFVVIHCCVRTAVRISLVRHTVLCTEFSYMQTFRLMMKPPSGCM